MNSRRMCSLAIAMALAFNSLSSLVAQTPPPQTTPAPPNAKSAPRELFVPFDDLNVLLGGQTRRVFMTRAEFEKLQSEAKLVPAEQVPLQVTVLSAHYDAVLEDGRAQVKGELQIEVLGDGIHAVPLAISGVGIRSAELDGEAAMLAEGPNGAAVLLVEGRGLHELRLEMVLPVTAAAAQQSLTWQLPVPPSTTFHLAVPGNVEMKSGAAIIGRRVDDEARMTHFDLLPQNGQTNLVMSLNNRRLRDETTVLARGVLIDEITQGYERLHATLSMNVLHGASDEFQFEVPAEFEITQVTTPLLARWSVDEADRENDDKAAKILTVKLRELTTERVVINIRADRSEPQLDDWHMPKLNPLDVAGFAGVVGVLLEERLASSALEPSGLIAIDNQVLTAALPASVLAAEPGMPRVRPLVTYYAPQAEFDIQTDFVKQPAKLFVSTNLLLTLHERGLEVDGGFALLPQSEKLFSFEFTLPTGWTIDTVRNAESQSLTFERYSSETGTRVRVHLPSGLAPGATLNVLFHATSNPSDWLSDWTEQTVTLPNIAVSESESVEETGALAVRTLDDLSAQPITTSGLIVLSGHEKNKYGGGNVATNLAWRYSDDPWQGTLRVIRIAPRLTARVLSFFQISHEALTSHFELHFNVEQARTQHLAFSLPETTPAEIAIRGMDDTVVKETNSTTANGRRQWSVQLAEKKTGRIRLAIDFVQPLSDQALRDFTLPELHAEEVAYQSGLVALEGHSEIDIAINKHPRSVDLGELIDAEYQVGKRLLGVFSYVGSDHLITVNAVRRNIHALPTTIVERAELVSLIGASRSGQTAARFALRSKALYLEVRLPEDSTLWSIMVDGQPSLPERQGDHLVVALPAAPPEQIRNLQVVYESPISRLMLRREVELLAPSLWQRDTDDSESVPVPLADLRWELVLPAGYRLVHAAGTVTAIDDGRPNRDAAYRWLDWLVNLGGQDLLPLSNAAHTAAQPVAAEHSTTYESNLSDAERMDAAKAYAPQKNMEQLESPDIPSIQPPAPAPEDAPQQDRPNQPSSQPQTRASDSTAARQSGTQNAQQRGASGSWALAGVRCLPIDLATANAGEHVTFTSLGIDPYLRATVVQERRWHWLGLACGLAVVAVGLLRVRNRPAARLRFVGIVVLVALLLPPVTGWTLELEPVVEAVLAGAVALIAITILSSLASGAVARGSRLATKLRARRAPSAGTLPPTTVASLLFCGLLVSGQQVALAQDPFGSGSGAQPASESASTDAKASPSNAAVTVTNFQELAALIESLQPGGPVAIPPDAIVIPYDPDAPDAIAGADKLLVPYDNYVRLWNAANPQQPLKTVAPPTAFAWSDARYETVLSSGSDLKITGQLNIHVLADGDVSVPLAIAGGVLESLTVDGQPARLQVVQANAPQPGPAGQPSPQSAATGKDQPAPAAGSLFVLHLNGKGQKQLVLQVRMKIEKRGGWHVVDGRLPAAPATQLTLHVPEPKTEVRFNELSDRAVHETFSADQNIETALPRQGRVAWQWRPKIAEASVDQGLTVDARSVFDVQEDALKFTWQGTFQFRRGRRDSFTLLVPKDYLVERVAGSNIRGWSVETVDDKQQLTIDLLTTVADRESLTVFIMRTRGQAAGEIDTPVIEVPEAMLQQGQLSVRRSSLLELRTNEATGLRRIDTPDESQWLTEQADASPLPLKPYQAFQFAQVPYSLKLTADSISAKTQVTAQTLLKLSQLETTLESRLIFQVQDRPLHHVRLRVAGNWKLQPPQAPVAYEWTVASTEDGRQTVDLYFASGLFGEVPLVLHGALEQTLTASATDGTIPPVPLPKIEVENVSRQVGDLVVTSDPAFAVRATQLQGYQTALLGNADSWLAANQRALARLLLHYTSAEMPISDLAGQLQVSLRAPQITALSVTNVKVTDRSIEETILIEFAIRAAGMRQLSVVLPSALMKVRVRGPLIRSQSWTPVGPEAGAPVRLQVELQEDVMGQYSLIIENDRVLASGEQSVPIPVIETGQTTGRFITLENSGRDELLVARRQSLEQLERSQAQWRFLTNLLGGKATEAFIVRENAEQPALSYTTKDRAVVQTVGARIGIAQTLVVVDDNGAYRARQEYRVENRTEQFLEIEMPDGARLWTVSVAGEPVKPMTGSAGKPLGNRVRIPLVKTAAGDLDYPVLIKYGGQLTRPGGFRTTTFPLVKTINLNVELSQVRLRLPETKRWLNFGGSMGRVMSEDELTAGWISFRTRQLNELSQLLGQADDNDFSKARATTNLKQLGQEVEELQRLSLAQAEAGSELQQQLAYNNFAWQDAQQRLSQTPAQKPSNEIGQRTNRDLLNQRLAEQGNESSLNVANASGNNFFGVSPTTASGSKSNLQNDFDAKWLAGNALKGADLSKLSTDQQQAAKMRARGLIAPSNEPAEEASKKAQLGGAVQLAAPEIATESEKKEKDSLQPLADDRAEQVYRYQQRLEQKSARAGGMRGSPASPFGAQSAQREHSMLPPDASATDSTSGTMQAGGMMEGDRWDKSRLPSGQAEISGRIGGGALGGPGLFGQAAPALPGLDVGATNPADAPAVPSYGYLASLETELPIRGVEYLFTTPRGEIEITAQSISQDTIDRLTLIALVIVGALCVWLASRIVASAWASRRLQLLVATAVAFTGFALIALSTPVYAMLALAAAAAIVLNR